VKKKATKKPIEVMDTGGIRITQEKTTSFGRDYPYYRITYHRGNRRFRERVKTLEAARKRGRELVEKLGDGTIQTDLKLKPKDNLVIAEALRLLKEAGGDTGLLEAVRQFTEAKKVLGSQSVIGGVKEYKEIQEKGKLPPITLPELVAPFLASVEKAGNTRRYKMDMRQKLLVAAKTFTGQVADIKTLEIDNWLDSLNGVSNRTRKNYRNALQTLFSFARDKGYLQRHHDTEVQFATDYKPEEPEIGIYTPEQLKILLFNIAPRLVPFVAIGGLAGMRSAEIIRMQWRNIRLDTNQIFVPKPASKTIAREIPICPPLSEWLKPFKEAAKGDDALLPRISNAFALSKRFFAAVQRIKGENGEPLLQIVHNGLRHTYISCRVKLIQNKHVVAMEAGNSPRIIDSNYKRIIENPEQAKEWFNIFPTPERLEELKSAIEEGL